jgi:hypothetical protein
MTEFTPISITTATPITKTWGDNAQTQYADAKDEYSKQQTWHKERLMHTSLFDDFIGAVVDPRWVMVGTWVQTDTPNTIFGTSVNNVASSLGLGDYYPFNPNNHLRGEFKIELVPYANSTGMVGLLGPGGVYAMITWSNVGTATAYHCKTYDGSNTNDTTTSYISDVGLVFRIRFKIVGTYPSQVFHIIFEALNIVDGDVTVTQLADYTTNTADIFGGNMAPYAELTGTDSVTPAGLYLDYTETDANRYQDGSGPYS